jgi:hypothetical protein
VTKRKSGKVSMSQATEPLEHPDDRAIREKCEAFGNTPAARAIAMERMEAALRLLTVFDDKDAAASLAELREWFWSDARVSRAT